jgi:hypothetical protein
MSLEATQDKSIEVYINSEVDKQTDDSESNFTAVFPQHIPLPTNLNYHLNVISAACPNTMPQFNTDQRFISYTVGANAPVTVEINKHIINSSTSDLATYLNSLCNPTDVNVSFSVNSQTRQLVVTNETTDEVLTFNVSGNYRNFWLKLGFTETQLDTGDLTLTNASGVKVTATGYKLPVLVATQRVYITCRDIKNNSFIPTIATNPPILCTVDMMGSFGSFNVFENDDENFWNHDLYINGSLNSLTFNLLDDRYQPIELLGGGLRLALVVNGTSQ